MQFLSNPHRNPHDKSISHFMDEETIIEKWLIPESPRISMQGLELSIWYLAPVNHHFP